MSNTLESFKKTVEDRWPVAYAELRGSQPIISPLKEHSLNTGKILTSLFKKQLEIVENRTRSFYNWERGEILKFAKIMGLLHDIGKSSSYYKSYFLNNSFNAGQVKVFFPYHEFAAGMLIAVMLMENPDEYARRKARLLMQATLRHHAAMKDRLTENLLCNNIIEITEGVEKKILEEFLKECADHPLCAVKLDDYPGKIRKRQSYCREGLSRCSSQQIEKDGQAQEILAVKVLAGLLVVADNLAAACERRAFPYNLPSYVRDWLKELRIDIDKIRADEPNICVCDIVCLRS
ncbi:MAG: CRISPR-associated endonuclease Cas3'' [Sulfolobales archaeon]